MTTRIFAFTQIDAGSYLLLNNDRTRFAVIEKYWEDGSLERAGRIIKGQFWRTVPVTESCTIRDAQGRATRVEEPDPLDPDDDRSFLSSWDWDGPFDTRREALDSWASRKD